MGFAEIIAAWKKFGIFEFYLPFVLMFTIFYGLLNKSKVFGEPKEKQVRNINVIVSFVAALFVMVSPLGFSMTEFFGTFFTQTMVILALLLSFSLIFYMMVPADVMKEMFKKPSEYAMIIIPVAILLVLIIFISVGGLGIFGIKLGRPGLPTIPGLGLSSEDLVVIVLIIVFVLVIWFITRGEKTEKPAEGREIVYQPVYR